MTQARRLLASVLNLSDVPADATLGNPPEWDSLAHMRLVLALEEATGKPLSPVQIVSLATLADIETLLTQLQSETGGDG